MIVTRQPSMTIRCWLWTAYGRFFGYRDGDELWSRLGQHVGRFAAGDIHAPDGCYIGELHRGRLVACLQKYVVTIEPFQAMGSVAPMTAFEATRAIALPSGFVEFKLRRDKAPAVSRRTDG